MKIPLIGDKLGKLGGALGVSGVPIQRYSMLRNSRFVQLPRMNFNQDMTPHQVHWALQDALEDQGVTDISAHEPRIGTHWSKTVPGENGKERNEADYCVFEGGLTGSRGQPVPKWAKILAVLLPIVGFMFLQVEPTVGLLFIVGAIGIMFYIWYWKTYRHGEVTAKYRGIYLKPEDSQASVSSWRFSVDLMFSVDAKKSVGMDLVSGVYDFVVDNLGDEIKSQTGYKWLPELLSIKPQPFEDRFPVRISEGKPGQG